MSKRIYTYEEIKKAANGSVFVPTGGGARIIVFKSGGSTALLYCYAAGSTPTAAESCWESYTFYLDEGHRFEGTLVKCPTFQPVEVQLNGNRKAVVGRDSISVGCETFEFEAVDKLVDAITKARNFTP